MWDFIKGLAKEIRVGGFAGFGACYGILLRLQNITAFDIKQAFLKLIIALCVAIVTGIGTALGSEFVKAYGKPWIGKLRLWLWKQYFKLFKPKKDGKGKEDQAA